MFPGTSHQPTHPDTEVNSFVKIIPALAQLIVDKTDLPIERTVLKAVSDDTVIVGLETSLTVPAGLKVKLDPIDLYLHNADTPEFSPYTMVPMEGQSLSGKTKIVVKEQPVNVGNRSELNTWLTRMLYSKETDISVKGNTTARLGALHFNVKLKKTVRISALDELRGLALVDAHIKLPPDEDGTNLIGNLTLPNWSDLEIFLGNLTFNAMAGDMRIGTTSVFDVLLPPGNTTLPFKGVLFLEELMDNLVNVLGSQGAALSKGVLELTVSGNETVIDGEHITYLESVLNAARIKSQIPIMQLLTDALASIREGDLSLDSLAGYLGPGIGGLLDDLFGGDGEGGIGGLVEEIMGGGEDSSDRGILGELLDKLDMQSTLAKRRFLDTVMSAAPAKR